MTGGRIVIITRSVPVNRLDEKEWRSLAAKVDVNCAGCGRVIRGTHLICSRCQFKPSTPTR